MRQRGVQPGSIWDRAQSVITSADRLLLKRKSEKIQNYSKCSVNYNYSENLKHQLKSKNKKNGTTVDLVSISNYGKVVIALLTFCPQL